MDREPKAGPPAAEDEPGSGDSSLQELPHTLTDTFEPRVEAEAAPVEPGGYISRYLIVRMLGAGGMGKVYAAYDPDLDRQIAVKLMRPSRRDNQADMSNAAQRLAREARALAKLTHPNVVAVYDAGIHDGAVFIAMELICGISLKEYCKGEPRPSWRNVLEKYIEAARGLAAAHAAGLVHRDFKPANVLVGDDGRVCVADFGLAVAAERGDSATHHAVLPLSDILVKDKDSLSGASLSMSLSQSHSQSMSGSLSGELDDHLTRTGALLGTPAYMAPEQHASGNVGPKADQYAFCVALYEGVYGERPFAIKRVKTKHALAYLVHCKQRERFSPAPEGSDVPAWLRQVIMRGLCADPNERFPSMNALIGALTNDPVARRHRALRRIGLSGLALGLGTAAVLGLLRGSPAAKSLCREAPRYMSMGEVWNPTSRSALRQAFLATGRGYADDTYERVSSMLDSYSQSWLAMHKEACEATHVHERQTPAVLDLRMHCLFERREKLRALVEVLTAEPDDAVLDKAVHAVSGLPALDYCADTEALAARVPPPEDPTARSRAEALERRLDRVEALLQAGKFPSGLALAEEVLAESKDLGYVPLTAKAAYYTARLRDHSGDYTASEALLRDAISLAAQAKDDLLIARAWNRRLIVLGDKLRRYDDALAVLEAARTAVERAQDEAARGEFLTHAGVVLWRASRYQESLRYHEQALAIAEAQGDPLDIATVLNNIANTLHESGKHADARQYHERALRMREEALGPNHPQVAWSLNNLGNVLHMIGDYREVRQYHERALRIREAALGPEHPDVAFSLYNLGAVLIELGRYEEALHSLTRALEIRERVLDPDNPLIAWSLGYLGSALERLGRDEEALSHHRRSLAIRDKRLDPKHPDRAFALSSIGNVLGKLGQHEEAVQLLTQAQTLFEDALGKEHNYVAYCLYELGEEYTSIGAYAEAVPILERSLAVLEGVLHEATHYMGYPLMELGDAMLAMQRHDEALGYYQRALDIRVEKLGEVHPEVAEALVAIGMVAAARGRASEGLAHLQEAEAICESDGVLCFPESEFALARALLEADAGARSRAIAMAKRAAARWANGANPHWHAKATAWLAAHKPAAE